MKRAAPKYEEKKNTFVHLVVRPPLGSIIVRPQSSSSSPSVRHIRTECYYVNATSRVACWGLPNSTVQEGVIRCRKFGANCIAKRHRRNRIIKIFRNNLDSNSNIVITLVRSPLARNVSERPGIFCGTCCGVVHTYLTVSEWVACRNRRRKINKIHQFQSTSLLRRAMMGGTAKGRTTFRI